VTRHCSEEVRILEPPRGRARQEAPELYGSCLHLVRKSRPAIDHRDDVLEVVARHEVAAASRAKRLDLGSDEERRRHGADAHASREIPLFRLFPSPGDTTGS
jgi:hypothetical protein